ncbi:SLC13 family permease [Methanobrevibacter sp.]|uniref:SLC13 family permease n=1 Tax=Methanobrevibacter sp. TaxID=66852 RepID=UPI0026DF88E9|nr:SLC13 family permease [Methanobrevibacter sp.]MDO5859398.1 SLC13 family permease [Methanobrevibacter sp.]
MNNIIDKSFNFFKKEIIFSISLILAIISCFFVKPSVNYFYYINWQTISLLFVIMVIVEVLKNLAIFERLVRKLLTKIKNTRGLVFVLVFTCFFSSIFITNDISLIIFVPFSIFALKKVDRSDLIILAISLQTIAANIGCMVLPIGAPHNIVMYTVSNISFESFFLLLLPYIVVSILFLLILLFLIPSDDIALPKMYKIEFTSKNFFKRVFLGVDYYLLLTFIALFILVGNLENISFFSFLFKKWIIGNEVFCGVIASQVISNVPAAILLSGFSTNYEAIIVGINIGGFGTLIASMANLISYKILVREYNEFKIKYLLVFTALNLVLLIILLGITQW